MYGRIDVLLAQMAACQDQTNWFASLDVALRGLSVEQANWHDEGTDNSIREIVSHLIFWNEQCLQQFKGTTGYETESNNDATFFRSDCTVSTTEEDRIAEWQSAVVRLNEVLSAWRTTLSECTEAKLETWAEPDKPWWMEISDAILHNTYHIGQIIHIRKRQGSWTKPVDWD